eukprot:jgi/Chrzof1/4298/Cz14g08010.t1
MDLSTSLSPVLLQFRDPALEQGFCSFLNASSAAGEQARVLLNIAFCTGFLVLSLTPSDNGCDVRHVILYEVCLLALLGIVTRYKKSPVYPKWREQLFVWS